MIIVEDTRAFENFTRDFQTNDSVVIPIQCDNNKHPLQTKLCLLYIQLLNGYEYVLPFSHSDASNIDVNLILNINTTKKVYTYDKKKLLHFVKWNNIFDIQLNYYLEKNESLPIDDITTTAHEHFYRQYYNIPNINCVVPLMKHIELCRIITNKIKEFIPTNDECYLSYNNEVINNLSYIESNGLQTSEGMVYSEYNIYTSTGRPSNRFGGINFAALNKQDGSRKKFISRFGADGMLVEFDYDAYHLRLIADIIGYNFPTGSVHSYLAKYYGNVSYEISKQLSFQYLYGYIPKDVVKTNPFFAKVQLFIDCLWDDYTNNNFMKSYIYNKKTYKKNLIEMTKNKLFNYFIQLAETENNMKMFTRLIPELNGYKSKPILYSYDSLLFDFNLQDEVKFLNKVKKIIEHNGKFPTKISRGINYHEMENITDRLS